MSLVGYFGKKRSGGSEVWMAKLQAEALRVQRPDARAVEEVYESVEEYDPVLRAHCRVDGGE